MNVAGSGLGGKGRIENLTDGILAIAMTQLVLDIKVPKLPGEVTHVGLEHRVMALCPSSSPMCCSLLVLIVT